MDPILLGLICLILMVALILLGVPIGFSLFLMAGLGNILISDAGDTGVLITANWWRVGQNFVLIALPLFVLMGQLAYKGGIATDLYGTVYRWLGRLPGGLAVTSTMTSAGFGAVTGSSFATVHTMGTMVMPEMQRYKYNPKLAAGSVASAGTLAILIPPSIILIIYGVLTETDPAELFIAGVIPGIMLALLFAGYILVRCMLQPEMGPKGPGFSWAERFVSLIKVLPALLIFLFVMVGIYLQWFSAEQAAATGCAAVLFILLVMRRLNRRVLVDSFIESAKVTGTIGTIILGGAVMAEFVAKTQLTKVMADFIIALEPSAFVVLLLFVVMYLVLGAVLDVLGMIILTLPFVLPVIESLGYSKIWFGVFVTVMTELALVTPPVGLNVFIMQTVVPKMKLTDIFIGVIPFVLIVLGFVILLMVFPEIALWLPGTLKSGGF